MRWSTAAAVCSVVAIVAMALPGCGSAESAGGVWTGPGYPAPTEDLTPSGASIADGFVVSEGSALLGPLVVTEVDQEDEPASWTAYLVVDGDPLEVWGAYLDQVAALGPGGEGEHQVGAGCAGYASGLVCGNWINLAAGEVKHWIDIGLEPLRDDRQGRSLITLQAAGLDGAELVPGRWRIERYIENPGELGPPVPTPSAQPAVGDRLDWEEDQLTGDLKLVEGTRLVARLGPGGVTGGLEVLLAVQPGVDPRHVMSQYEGQCERTVGSEIASTAELDNGEATQYRGVRNSAGIGSCSVTLSDSDDGTDYIVLTHFGD